MSADHSPAWLLKKHSTGNIHGPVSFEKLLEWAGAAQINPQDCVSSDGQTWTKAPMINELHMDWLIEVPDNPLYGPTTSGALLEFLKMGEINTSTRIVNCCTGQTMVIEESPFYKELDPAVLKKRLSELEGEVRIASKTIARLEARIAELERAVE